MEPKRQRRSVGGEALPFVLKALHEPYEGFMPGVMTSLNPNNEVIINANYLAVKRYHLN
jgi:hypothetical protein